ncbi:hypothetical protein AZE42_02502 [Rhizopogon vesiculosus]|uniref:Uncharacterized protein n=1 Tax=Rhizopogon vesiculosus TaxID=180088 RepID=A0A1J8R5B9_9AGAM|nr:hypothetical protein AZE42_02502 [Rhizopogon vesiculosus]
MCQRSLMGYGSNPEAADWCQWGWIIGQTTTFDVLAESTSFVSRAPAILNNMNVPVHILKDAVIAQYSTYEKFRHRVLSTMWELEEAKRCNAEKGVLGRVESQFDRLEGLAIARGLTDEDLGMIDGKDSSDSQG